MQLDEIIETIQRGDAVPPASGFDAERIRRQGRRLSRRRHAGLAGLAATGLAAAAGVVALTAGLPGQVPGGGSTGEVAGQRDATLTDWEQRALAAVPDAYAVAGTVVVPGPVDPDGLGNQPVRPSDIDGRPVELGWNGYTDPGYVASTVAYPELIERRQMLDDRTGKDVVADNGPLTLACVTPGDAPCYPTLLIGDARSGWFHLSGFGTDEFLEPGAGVEVFVDELFPRSVGEPPWSVIGGFHGVARSIELTLVDGTRAPASIDAGIMVDGATLFWAETPAEVARITAYGSDGEVVAEHEVRDCSGGVDCEVR